MCEKGVSYAAETIGAAVISAGAFVGLDAHMSSWGADKETVGIHSHCGWRRYYIVKDRVTAKLEKIAKVVF
uniref:Uncharacterized protein n=1 Tax=Acrobeloides nanus TaxID=290746 RepID=A0A914E5I3_9BILA